ELRWVPADEATTLPLHPALRNAWPHLHEQITAHQETPTTAPTPPPLQTDASSEASGDSSGSEGTDHAKKADELEEQARAVRAEAERTDHETRTQRERVQRLEERIAADGPESEQARQQIRNSRFAVEILERQTEDLNEAVEALEEAAQALRQDPDGIEADIALTDAEEYYEKISWHLAHTHDAPAETETDSVTDKGTYSDTDVSETEEDPDAVPGSLGPDGFRKFATEGQAIRYAEQFLNNPERNPHAFANLPKEQREAVQKYIKIDNFYQYLPQIREGDSREPGNVWAWEVYETHEPEWLLYEMTGFQPMTLESVKKIQNTPGTLSYGHFKALSWVRSMSDHRLEKTIEKIRESDIGRMIEAFGGIPSIDELERNLDLVDQALDRPLPEPLTVRRPLPLPGKEKIFFGFYSRYLLKDSIQTSPNVLAVQVRREAEIPLLPSELVLALPDGSRGLWFGESEITGYRKLLLPRGTRYVINRAFADDTYWERFDAEVLPPAIGTSTTPEGLETAPGVRAPDGARRFADDVEAAGYGAQVLDNPHRNPHAYTRLPREQRDALDTYMRIGVVFNQSLRLAQDERITAYLQEQRANVGPGLLLFDLGRDGRFPTLDDLAHAPRPLPAWHQTVVDSILNAPDPEQERRTWIARSGLRGRLTDVFGHFPDANDIRRFVSVLDQAFGPRTLPETVSVRRSLDNLTFLGGYDPANPQALVGTVQTEPGYLSTSLGLTPGWKKAGFTLLLTVPAGTPSHWLGTHSGDPTQRELILPRGTSYQITDVSDFGGHTFLTAEVLRTAPAPFTAQPTPHTEQPPAPQAHTAPASHPFLPPIPNTAPGQVNPDGYRTFTTNDDGYAYGEQVLGHPHRNPHAFP
uniref:ADP-ribosyltransferase n=1 Tax=Nocardiopsis sp. CNT312 TaxID=1137268 RepID=UPI0026F3B0FE